MSEEPKYVDEKGLVICQLCGKSMMTVAPPHLYYKHNKMTVAEYKKQFPDAPTFNDEFSARSKFGKEKLFKMQEAEKEPKIETDLAFTENQTPTIEELTIKEFSKETPVLNPIEKSKLRILDHLRIMYPEMKQNYMIQKFDGQGRLMYEYITDFCDPVSKVNVEFPRAFWHNHGVPDPLRNHKLKQDGWTIFEVMSKHTGNEEIDRVLKGSN